MTVPWSMPAGAAEAFVEACRKKGLTFVVFVRHASSAPLKEGAASRADKPHDWKIDDQMRVLTDKGKEQCEAAAASWFGALSIRAALCSPARRASETAIRMTAAYETEERKAESVYLRMVVGVHPGGMSEVCESLFDTMGYGPLKSFFDAEGGEAAFQAYADDVSAELEAAIAACEDTGGEGLAVFGHAVFLNAIAYKVAQAAGASDDAKMALLEMDLGETQGIHITLPHGAAATVTKLPQEA